MTAYPWTIKICSKFRRDTQAADMVKVKTQSGKSVCTARTATGYGKKGGSNDMTEEQRQRIRVVLAEAIEALKAIDPYLDADNAERSSLARHCIRCVLREMNAPEGSDDA